MAYVKVAVLALLLGFSSFVLSEDLPPYTGQYGVGNIDIEVPVVPRNISNTTIKATGEPAFQLETVLFSVFYPSDTAANSSKSPHPWIPRPIDLVARGFAIYANNTGSELDPSLVTFGLETLASGINIPAAVDAPLFEGSEKFPVLVFSHGDVTLRTWYSQYCGELASRGVITVAVEHRDGSEAGSVIKREDGSERNVTYYTVDQFSPQINSTELKMQQRNFRQAEVQEIIGLLRNITEGGGDIIFKLNTRNEGENLRSWKDRIDLGRLLVGGHSFGATSALQTLEEAPNGTVPAYGALLFDPGKESGPLNSDVAVSILIADSEEWSSQPTEFYGHQHFDVVKDIAQGALNRTSGSWFMTLMGASHTSITDASVIAGPLASFFASSSFNATIDPLEGLAQYVKVSTEFFDFITNGTRSGVLATGAAYPQYNVSNQTTLESTPEEVKEFWQVHVAPALNASNGTSGTNGTDSSGHPSRAASFGVQYGLLVFPLMIGVVYL